METKKSFYRIFGIAALTLLVCVAVLHFAWPDRKYSETEKRELQQAPALSFQTLTDGTFMSKIEDYLADQFPFRDALVSAKGFLSVMEGVRESSGVYYCGNDLIERFDTPDETLLNETADAINTFVKSQRFQNAYVLIAPTAASVNKGSLPLNAINADESAYIEAFADKLNSKITMLDAQTAISAMKGNGEQAYYHTDHHWTTDAAYRVFQSAKETADWVDAAYETGVVTNIFRGSLASASGFPVNAPDAITVYTLKDGEKEIPYTVNYVNEGRTTPSVYDYEKLDSENPYELFFGGNFAQLTIETGANTDRTLLLLKDSYANCFIPFLLRSYARIIVVDPRYYTDDLSTLFLQYRFSDVMFLYNASTLSKDKNLKMVLSE